MHLRRVVVWTPIALDYACNLQSRASEACIGGLSIARLSISLWELGIVWRCFCFSTR